MLGRHHTEEAKAKISLANIGKQLSKETRAKISATSKVRLANPKNHPNYGKHHSEETRAKISSALTGRPLSVECRSKISQALTGHQNTPKGIHRSPDTEFKKGHPPTRGTTGKTPWNKGESWPDGIKDKIRRTEKGRHLHPETEIKRGQRISPRTELTSERVKAWWKDPEYRTRVITGRLKNRRPTEPERKLLEIIERHSLPFKYTGNGSFIIEGLNPDFIEVNGKKIAVDVFGDYWHTLKADKETYNEQGRKAIFAKYGWKLIVIWESELKLLPEEKIVGRIGGHL